ncbi:MAG: response regulator, partial [Thermoanaerobaculia bacterium]
PSDAIVEAKNSRFALVVSDVDMPQMNGFLCRDRIRMFPGHANTPFLFMSSADRSIEMEIVARLGEDKLLLKPFSPAELRRTVFALLEPVNVERGSLPAALSPILERVAAQGESGVLSAVQGTRTKRIVFQDGKIVFAASNDPRDLIGQALLRTGLVKEKDLLEAFSMTGMKKDSTGTPFLAAALTAMRKVTPEQTQAVFVGKIKESVLEIFLWFEGMVEYLAGPVEKSDAPFPVALDTAEMRQEGERRREKWRRVVQVLPDSTVTFKRAAPAWPDAITKNPGDRLLTKLIDKGLSMAQILLELRGQDYAVGVRLATLVLQKVIKVAPPSGFRPIKPVKPDTVPDGQTLQLSESTFTGIGGAPPLSAEDLLAAVEAPDEGEILRRIKG